MNNSKSCYEKSSVVIACILLLLLAVAMLLSTGVARADEPKRKLTTEELRQQRIKIRDEKAREAKEAAEAYLKHPPLALGKRNQAAADEIVRLIRAGQHRKASAILIKLRKAVRTKQAPRHAVVEGLMAQIGNLTDRHKIAMFVANPFVTENEKYLQVKHNLYLQLAHAHRGLATPPEMGKKLPGLTQEAIAHLDKALKLYNWIALKENDGDTIRQSLAIEGVAHTRAVQQQYQKSADALGIAISNLKIFLNKDNADLYNKKETLDQARQIRKRLRAQLADVNELLFVERVGPIFLIYRDAQRMRLIKKNHIGAMAKYNELIEKYPDSTYADAARLYAGLCAIEIGGYAAGERRLLAFIKTDEHGLYRGEALLQLGRLALEKRLDQEKATAYFMRLDKWIKAVRTGKHPAKLVDILPGAMKEIAPPKVEKIKDFWGNIKTQKVQPDDLVNRVTSDWYLDDLEENCALSRGFLHFVAGEHDAAITQYDRVIELDTAVKEAVENNTVNVVYYLRAAAKRGYMEAHPQELKLYPPRLRFIISLADFYHATQQYGEAQRLFEQIRDNKYGRLNRKQLDYIYYGITNAIHYGQWKAGGNSREIAFDVAKKILKHMDGTYTESRAVLALVNLGARSNNKEQRRLYKVYAARILKSGRKDEIAIKIRINLAVAYHHEGDDETAARLLNGVRKSDKKYHGYAKYLIDDFARMRNKKNNKQ